MTSQISLPRGEMRCTGCLHTNPLQSYAVVAAFGPPAPADSMTEHENSEVHFIGVALIIRPDLSLYRNKTALSAESPAMSRRRREISTRISS